METKNKNMFRLQFLERNYLQNFTRIYLGPVLFNIFIFNISFYNDRYRLFKLRRWHPSYTKGDTFDDVIETSESESIRLFQWFKYNQVKANKRKCNLLVSDSHKATNVCVGEAKSSDCKNLLGVKIDPI